MESNPRFFRRRATEELSAASRAVTGAAREHRLQLAHMFLNRLDDEEARKILGDFGHRRQLRKFPVARQPSLAEARA